MPSVRGTVADWLERQIRSLGRLPARQIIWALALVPLILPAPAIALIMSVQAMRRDGFRAWRLPAGIALINLLVSAALMGWLSNLYAVAVLDRILDILDLLLPGSEPPANAPIPV